MSEYFLYDPDYQYLEPTLQEYRLVDGAYVEILPVRNWLLNPVLGLELGFQVDGELGPVIQQWLLRPAERAETAEAKAEQETIGRQQAEAKAQQEAIARKQAEAELAKLRAELQRRQT